VTDNGETLDAETVHEGDRVHRENRSVCGARRVVVTEYGSAEAAQVRRDETKTPLLELGRYRLPGGGVIGPSVQEENWIPAACPGFFESDLHVVGLEVRHDILLVRLGNTQSRRLVPANGTLQRHLGWCHGQYRPAGRKGSREIPALISDQPTIYPRDSKLDARGVGFSHRRLPMEIQSARP